MWPACIRIQAYSYIQQMFMNYSVTLLASNGNTAPTSGLQAKSWGPLFTLQSDVWPFNSGDMRIQELWVASEQCKTFRRIVRHTHTHTHTHKHIHTQTHMHTRAHTHTIRDRRMCTYDTLCTKTNYITWTLHCRYVDEYCLQLPKV